MRDIDRQRNTFPLSNPRNELFSSWLHYRFGTVSNLLEADCEKYAMQHFPIGTLHSDAWMMRQNHGMFQLD